MKLVEIGTQLQPTNQLTSDDASDDVALPFGVVGRSNFPPVFACIGPALA